MMKPLLLLITLAVAACSARAQTGASAKEQQLFGLLNQERFKAGLSALHWDSNLARAARAHSRLLVSNRQLSHQFRGEAELQTRVAATSLRFDAVGENVSFAPNVNDAHRELMHSPPHRANILSTSFNAVGIAIVPHGRDLYLTEDFAHLTPAYTEKQFQDAVIAAFNLQRHASRIEAIDVRSDPRLKKSACSKRVDPRILIHNLPGVTDLVVFTSSDPEQLPAHMQSLARDPTLHRMNIGVCFMPGAQHGFASFQVVASFYPVN